MPGITLARGLQLDAPGVFAFRELPAMQPGSADVVVEVAGCGLCCHTDIGFAYDGVAHALFAQLRQQRRRDRRRMA